MKHARFLSTVVRVGALLVVLGLVGLGTPRATAALWYVDPTSIGANNGTSWADAWGAFDQINWGVINPGDTLYLHGGSGSSFIYAGDFLSPLTVGKSGTAGNPITIAPGQDAGHDGIAILTGQYVDLQGHNYITINGNFNGVQHLYLTDFYDDTQQTFANKVLADGTTGFTMQWCMASNVNQCVSLVGAQGFNICSNTLIARGDAAVRAVNCPDNGYDSHYVQGNFIICDYNTNQTAFPLYLGPDGVQGSHGLTIRSNIFTLRPVNFKTSQQHPDYTQLIGNHNKIYGNQFINIGDSANDFDWRANSTPHDIHIYNNVYNITEAFDPYPEYIRFYVSPASAQWTTFQNVLIANNTFCNNTGPNARSAISFLNWGANGNTVPTNVRIVNNIAYNCSLLFSVNNPSLPSIGLTFTNDVVAPGFTIGYQGTTYNATTWSAVEPTRIAGVPGFVGATNFHMATTNSVGIGTAQVLNSLFTTDADTVVRGASWDNGAYQFQGSSTNIPPNTPTNFTPPDGFTGIIRQPGLTGNAYSDPQGNSQIGAEFQVYQSDGTTLVVDSGDIGPVTSWLVTTVLNYSTTYKWRVRYLSSANLWSGWSTLTSFTTMDVPSVVVKIKVDRLKTNQGRGKP